MALSKGGKRARHEVNWKELSPFTKEGQASESIILALMGVKGER